LLVATVVVVTATRVLWWIAAEPAQRVWSGLHGVRPAGGWTLELAVTGGLAFAAMTATAAVLALTGVTLLRELVVAAAPALEARIPAIGPSRWRWWVASTFGLTLVFPALATSAVASDDAGVTPCGGTCAGSLDGLPMPDLPLTTSGRHRGPPEQTVVVRRGDSLWSLSTALVGEEASNAEIASFVADLYTTNRARIGGDPDLIQPRTVMTVPGGTDDPQH
jgi:nucleoid-associated protein YgaU